MRRASSILLKIGNQKYLYILKTVAIPISAHFSFRERSALTLLIDIRVATARLPIAVKNSPFFN